ncbi:Hok/Gef family protein [Pseudescherichia sp.]|uniref:Hok/Gef family protein n=1 Tax=Pseudescherichia sp. TaxID=2055881 RepID=UPI00289F3B8A|nr:Hok/Gef family protein [Pseudescherichia sp.]
MTPLKYLLAILLVVCLTILTFALINRGKLCELNIKNDRQEVAAKLACTAG